MTTPEPIRYRCNRCAIDFEVAGDAPLRCPECLRQLGLEPLGKAARSPRGHRGDRRFVLIAGLVLALLVAAGVGGVLLHRQTRVVPERGQLALLSPAKLQATLAQRGVPVQYAVAPFSIAPDLVKRLAGERLGGALQERAERIAGVLGSRLLSVKLHLTSVTAAEPRSAQETAAALVEGKLASSTSLELAVLIAAVLRAADLDAVVCELARVDAPVPTPDVSAVLGRYAVAVYRPGKLGSETLAVFDAGRATRLPSWAGTSGDATMRSLDRERMPLDDGSVAGRLLMLRALVAAERAPIDTAMAYELSRHALAAAEPAPTLLLGRALVLARSGGRADALALAQQAHALRPNAATATVLAQMVIAQGDAGAAQRLLEQALTYDANFFPARAVLTTLHLMAGERDKAEAHYQAALKVAADEPLVLALRASREMADGAVAAAVGHLRQAVQREPSEKILLQLYLALRQLGGNTQAEAQQVKHRLLRAAADREALLRALSEYESAAQSHGGAPAETPTQTAPPAPMAPTAPPEIRLPDVKLGE